ncbi:MAG: cytochrome P450 [Chloroflexi bacterium]|nr:cytochrome P450 [Chloroflexota bacterium]
MKNKPTPELGRAVMRSLIQERSPLGPLKVMAAHIGRFFQIPLPGFRPYVVFGPEAARKVLVTEKHKLLWRNHDPVTDLLRRGVLVTDGEEHEQLRGLMEPSLHPAVLHGYAKMIVAQTDRVTAAWGNGQIVDLLIEARKIALLIILEALFSVDAWDDLPRIWKPILKAIEYVSPGAWILWRRIPRPGYAKYLKALDDYLYGIIQERRKRKEGKQDLLQHLIDAGLSDDVIRDQMLTMLIAGHDTSTALLAWVFVLLGQHPAVHAQLVSEIDTLDKSPLLDQVIKEALRLYPPIHIGNRIAAEELDFGGGNCIPAGERMFYSIYLTQRDPAIWEAADEFRPERFTRGRKTPPMSYIPFGGGPRACIGAAFGQAEARLVLSRLLQGFTFEPLDMDKIHAHMGATLEPRPAVRMKATRRTLP